MRHALTDRQSWGVVVLLFTLFIACVPRLTRWLLREDELGSLPEPWRYAEDSGKDDAAQRIRVMIREEQKL